MKVKMLEELVSRIDGELVPELPLLEGGKRPSGRLREVALAIGGQDAVAPRPAGAPPYESF